MSPPVTPPARKAEADWLSAFGDPTRIAIIRFLATGEKIVTELATLAKTEIVNVSHHLGVMRGAGVVKSVRDGRMMRYTLLGATATTNNEVEMTHASGVKVVIPLL
jgi:ArsR family transcriptional regulator